MTSTIELQKTVPNFTIHATSDLSTTLNHFHGKNIVLYFYPKDNTPGCTSESKDFRDLFDQFDQANTVIFGISRDTLTSHEKFKQKHNLPFELIADPEEQLCQAFQVIRPKLLFGKSIIGLIRSTFLIDAKGVLVKEWRKVKVKGHAEAVLEEVNLLNK